MRNPRRQECHDKKKKCIGIDVFSAETELN